MRYELNSPSVVFEDFGTDAVILNLASGSYFSLSDRAKVFFEQLMATDDPDGFIAALGARDAEAGAQAKSTLAQMESNDLLRQVPANGPDSAIDLRCDAVLSSRPTFTFESYSDLADVIAADPIHDFDPGTGLPRGAYA